MVSRSLEKMMLIAVGLSTAVIIGVPVLLYAIDTMSYSAQLQNSQITVESIFNATGQIDTGVSNYTTINVYIPTGMSISVAGSTLTISMIINNQITSWSKSYNHQIMFESIPTGGNCLMIFRMESNVILISHVYITD